MGAVLMLCRGGVKVIGAAQTERRTNDRSREVVEFTATARFRNRARLKTMQYLFPAIRYAGTR